MMILELVVFAFMVVSYGHFVLFFWRGATAFNEKTCFLILAVEFIGYILSCYFSRPSLAAFFTVAYIWRLILSWGSEFYGD